jgi:hypothetical protein
VATVDIPGLTKTGSTVEGCSCDFDKARTAHAGQLGPGVDASWSAGAALANAASVWQAFLTQLAGQVRDLGQGLTTSAREYQAADDAAARRIGNAATGIPAGHPAQARAHGYEPQ